jgi:hypothetical protein
MTMLKLIITAMRRDVLSPRHRATFEAWRTNEPCLEPFASVEALLSALEDNHEESYPIREALTRALLRRYRTLRHTLPSSILLLAFRPMLMRLRLRVVTSAIPPDDVDQLVVTSFLAAVAEFAHGPPIDRLALRLRQRTARYVFAALPNEIGEPRANVDVETFLSETMEVDSADTSAEASAAVARHDLDALAAGAVRKAVVDVLCATFEHPEGLRAYVMRTAAGELEERERTYQRLKRARTRALSRLRLRAAEEQKLAAAG